MAGRALYPRGSATGRSHYLTKQAARGGGIAPPAASRHGVRHVVDRYPVVATELNSAVRLQGRMSDLGMQGCYVETSNPFPVGAIVRLRLANGKESVEITGRICHSQPTLGMGLAFLDLKFDQLVVLEGWLARPKRPACSPGKPAGNGHARQRLAGARGRSSSSAEAPCSPLSS